MDKRLIIACSSLLALPLLASLAYIHLASQSGFSPPKLSYQVLGCIDRRAGELSRARSTSLANLTILDSRVRIAHKLTYVCCADIVVELNSSERIEDYTVLRILERNIGEVCRCICTYTVLIELSDLRPGRYKIEIYGVEHEATPARKLWEAWIEI